MSFHRSYSFSSIHLKTDVMSFLIGLQVFVTILTCVLATNATGAEKRESFLKFSRQPHLSGSKVLPGLESVMSVMGPLALAAMVSLPFVAPAAAALLPLASMTSVFGRRRRYLDSLRQNPLPDSEVLMRRIHAAAIRRNAY
ncbi:uncharacterized protein LOC118184399 [Stegodyphus dumicola]|uniref:uncharacterized protein LOC118184399 n=1 Tax=Stegodyphus dumicola TaxID=202533 RepID=UPI0015ADBE5D|nr:uncharacterized protein LOC118184399 [Stegodyphus dumicola]